MKALIPTGFDPSTLVPTRDESGADRYQVTIDSPMRMRREELLIASAPLTKIAKINGPATHIEVAQAMRNINALLKQVEEDRKAVKAPILKLGKDIDAKASEFCAELEAQKARLAKLATDYELEEARRKREREAEAERARQAEEAAVKAAEDEATRLQAEADKLARAGNVEAAQAVEDALFEKQLEIEQASMTAELAVPKREKVEGMSARVTLDFELAGDSRAALQKLYAAHPSLVKLEADRSAILDRLNRDRFGCPEDVTPQVPGLRIFETIARRFTR